MKRGGANGNARDSDIIFEAKTIQTSNVKTLFEVLKDVIVDVNLMVSEDKIKIIALNNTHMAVIHARLNAQNFESFYCSRTNDNPLILGIHTLNIFKIIKTIKHDETLTFYVRESQPNFLYIKKENNQRNNVNTFKYQLIDINQPKYSIPDLEFNTVITMNSNELQKLLKDYNSLNADFIEIKNVDNKVFFSGVGEFSSFEGVFGNSDMTTFKNNKDGIVQGKFDIKYLLLFSKASNLSTVVELYLKNDYPLIMNYKVGTLGDLRFIVSGIENN
jgi:proliferating cell nuclear antigen